MASLKYDFDDSFNFMTRVLFFSLQKTCSYQSVLVLVENVLTKSHPVFSDVNQDLAFGRGKKKKKCPMMA